MTDLDTLRVRNETVWKQIKYLLLGSAVLFLINIFFGFDNALTEGDIPRWQVAASSIQICHCQPSKSLCC